MKNMSQINIVRYYTPIELQKILHYSDNTIRTYLARPEFSKFERTMTHVTKRGQKRKNTIMYRVDREFMFCWKSIFKNRKKYKKKQI